jgi:hypothetical protein
MCGNCDQFLFDAQDLLRWNDGPRKGELWDGCVACAPLRAALSSSAQRTAAGAAKEEFRDRCEKALAEGETDREAMEVENDKQKPPGRIW